MLHIDDCPNWVEAGRRVRVALDGISRNDVEVGFRLISTPDEALGSGFAGSPTILADGRDLFDGDPTADLACRVYRTPTGFAGTPTIEMIAEELDRRTRH